MNKPTDGMDAAKEGPEKVAEEQQGEAASGMGADDLEDGAELQEPSRGSPDLRVEEQASGGPQRRDQSEPFVHNPYGLPPGSPSQGPQGPSSGQLRAVKLLRQRLSQH